MFNEKKNNDALLSDLVSELNVKKLTGKCLRLIDAQLQCSKLANESVRQKTKIYLDRTATKKQP